MDEVQKVVLKGIGSLQLVGLSNADGRRDFSTIEKVFGTPTDLGGIKMRVIESPLQAELVMLMGGSPTPIPWQKPYSSRRFRGRHEERHRPDHECITKPLREGFPSSHPTSTTLQDKVTESRWLH